MWHGKQCFNGYPLKHMLESKAYRSLCFSPFGTRTPAVFA
jgi:hypothetical protein